MGTCPATGSGGEARGPELTRGAHGVRFRLGRRAGTSAGEPTIPLSRKGGEGRGGGWPTRCVEEGESGGSRMTEGDEGEVNEEPPGGGGG